MVTCELSASGHAFSTVLTAFVGSILNGLFNGAFIAFVTAWICWFSPIRIILSGVYEYWLAIKAGTDFASVERGHYESIEMNTASKDAERAQQNEPVFGQPQPTSFPQILPAARPGAQWVRPKILREVTMFGWLGWIWSAVYTPVSQSIWVAANAKSNDGAILLVRSVAIGVSALSLTYDTKQRYGAALGRKWGSWAFVAFNLWNATACFVLGAEVVVVIVLGALRVEFLKDAPALYAIYPIFACIWAFGSFKLLPVIDGSRKGIHILVDILMGVFGGVFVAAPAFVYLSNVDFQNKADEMFGKAPASGLSLGAYLSCKGAPILAKLAAVMP